MASQVLSGANNASYTNNTGQNVRLIINYMSNVTSMTWAEVTVTGSSTTIGKDIPTLTSLSGSASVSIPGGTWAGRSFVSTPGLDNMRGTYNGGTGTANISLSNSNSITNSFPMELMLASGQSFSAVCGAYNAIVIKEDGT